MATRKITIKIVSTIANIVISRVDLDDDDDTPLMAIHY
jgi:hypothetical protein